MGYNLFLDFLFEDSKEGRTAEAIESDMIKIEENYRKQKQKEV